MSITAVINDCFKWVQQNEQVPTRQVPQHLTSGGLFEALLVFGKGRQARPGRGCAGGDKTVEFGFLGLRGSFRPSQVAAQTANLASHSRTGDKGAESISWDKALVPFADLGSPCGTPVRSKVVRLS